MDSSNKPSTFLDTIRLLDDMLSTEQKKEVYELSESEVRHKLHFTLGLWIRNNWIYNKDCSLGVYLSENLLLDIDECSSAIIMFYHRHLHGKPLLIDQEIRRIDWMRPD